MKIHKRENDSKFDWWIRWRHFLHFSLEFQTKSVFASIWAKLNNVNCWAKKESSSKIFLFLTMLTLCTHVLLKSSIKFQSSIKTCKTIQGFGKWAKINNHWFITIFRFFMNSCHVHCRALLFAWILTKLSKLILWFWCFSKQNLHGNERFNL